MKTVPSRLIVLGGGSAGVEIAQVVRRLGGEAVLVEGADRLIPESPPHWAWRSPRHCRRDGIELHLGVRAPKASRDGDDYVLSSRTGPRCEVSDCSWRPVAVPVSKGSGSRPSASRPTRTGSGSTSICVPARGSGPSGTSTGSGPDPRRRVRGRRGGGEHRGESHPTNYEAVPRVTYTDPQAAAVGAAEAPYSSTTLLSECPRPRRTPRLRRVERLLDPAQRRRPVDRRLCPRT
jgi:hypothetical protein